jgi:cytochrome c biogenesis protein CcdA
MMETITNFFTQLVQSGGLPAFIGAFLGGLLMSLNPCVLVIIPLTMGFIGGLKDGVTTKKALFYSLLMVFGYALQLALLFTIASAFAPYLKGAWMQYVIAGICILLGLHFLEIFQMPALFSQDKLPKYTGALGAVVFGFLFGFISLPCTGPVLLLIISIIPLKGSLFGGGLMLCYGMGQMFIVILAGTSMGISRHLIESKGAQKTITLFRKIAAVLIIGVGLYLIWTA